MRNHAVSKYKAFISYSLKADKDLATALQSALHRFAKPWYKLRAMRVFRDQANLALNPHLWKSIKEALDQSEYFILLASPEAAKSAKADKPAWVPKEVDHWLSKRTPETLLIVLTDGEIVWDQTAGDFDWTKTTALPSNLGKIFSEEPLYLDFRSVRTQTDLSLRSPDFLNKIARIAASLHGRSLDELIGDDIREHKRTRRLAWSVVIAAGLVFVVIGGTTWLWQKGFTLDQALLRVQSVFVSIHANHEMQVVPVGIFRQGDTNGLGDRDEQPVRDVMIKSFAMGKYEVTFDEYDRFAIATGRSLPSDQGWGRGRRPVINVPWEDSKAYAEWLSKATGKRYRLPTESEWEYAARSGGKNEIWAGTLDEAQLTDYAVYAAHSQNRTAPVGGKTPNGLGLHDTSGNVWEWVEDCWHKNYDDGPRDGSAWVEAEGGNCEERVRRGGAWVNRPEFLRVSNRGRGPADYRDTVIGFRLAQDIE